MIFPASPDPAYHSSDDGAAWKFQGEWAGTVGTPVSSRVFVAAKHVGGGIGDTISFRGADYTVIEAQEKFDLRVYRVSADFPEFAPLYTASDEVGQTLRFYGRGVSRGEEIVANRVGRTTEETTLKALGCKKKEILEKWPLSTVSGQSVTLVKEFPYQSLAGWRWGQDRRLRWGSSIVSNAESLLSCTFQSLDENSAALAVGDSSGGAFIHSGGEWKLAGVANSVTEEGASYLDKSGICIEGTCFPGNDTEIRPTRFFFTRVSFHRDWLDPFISAS